MGNRIVFITCTLVTLIKHVDIYAQFLIMKVNYENIYKSFTKVLYYTLQLTCLFK